MDFMQVFNRVMVEQVEITLATSVDNVPNVRIVNFYYNPDNSGVLYFSSFGDNPKVAEFAKNSRVAFSTIPCKVEEHVRVNNAEVKTSKQTIYDFKDEFIRKLPDYEMIIDQAGSQLVLFEVHFEQAKVIVDFTKSGAVSL